MPNGLVAIPIFSANEVWDKVMFLHMSVILFTGGGDPQPREWHL